MKNTHRFRSLEMSIILCLCVAIGLAGCKSAPPTSQSTPVVEEPKDPVNPLVPTSFGPNYKYSELMTKDYEEMFSMVQNMIRKAQKAASKGESNSDSEAVAQLGRALKLIYSRPDADNMVSKLVAEVRRELSTYGAFDDTVSALVTEALTTYSNSDASVGTRSTCLVELENILADIRPEALNGNKTLKWAIAKIRDAKLQVPTDVKKDRRMRGMFQTKNPSEEAQKVLAAIAPSTKK